LNQLEKPKSYCISLAKKRYNYNRTQLFFLSLEAFQHFESSTDDFVIEDNLDFHHSIHFSQDALISCFDQLHSLFLDSAEILLTLENRSTFQILGDVLGNPYLKSQCKKVSPKKNKKFRLSSESLSVLILSQINKLNNFRLIINGQEF
jgi:hypothetical protein